MMTPSEKKVDDGGTTERIFFKEACRTQEAEILLASLEDYIIRRFNPKPHGFLSKGVFQLKLDELRSKVDTLEYKSQDVNLLWICEKITLLLNLCRNLERAIQHNTLGSSADEGVAACNDTDHLLDCLQLELRQRGEVIPALEPVIKRLTKCKAHYLTELAAEWCQQIRWQNSDYPRIHRLIISLEAGRTFALLSGLRNSSNLTTDILEAFIDSVVNPVVNDRCILTVTEKSAAVQLEATFVEKQTQSCRVDPVENLRIVYSFISRTFLPLLALQEDSREIAAVLNLLGRRARQETPESIYDLATSIQADLPQTASLLSNYANEAEAFKEALRIVGEMKELMLTALEPTEQVEIANLPKSLTRTYVVSCWIPSLAESVLRLENESVLLSVFSCFLHHLRALEGEALCNSFKAAVCLNNCIYLANRCSLHCPVPTNYIIMVKQRGISLFLRFVNEHRMGEVSTSLPVASALKSFSSYLASLYQMESSWRRCLPFESYSKATGLLFNSLSSSLESYIFQQKFLIDSEVNQLKSLLLQAVCLAEKWQSDSSETLHVSSVRLGHLMRLLQMTSHDILLKWKSSIEPLSSIYTADQVASLAKARFTLEEFDRLHGVLF